MPTIYWNGLFPVVLSSTSLFSPLQGIWECKFGKKCHGTAPWPASLLARVTVISISVLLSPPSCTPLSWAPAVSPTEISALLGSVPWDKSLKARPSLNWDQSPEDRQREQINFIKGVLKVIVYFWGMISGMPGIATANILIVERSKDTQRSITRDIYTDLSSHTCDSSPSTPISEGSNGPQHSKAEHKMLWSFHLPRTLVAGHGCSNSGDNSGTTQELQSCDVPWAWSCPAWNDGSVELYQAQIPVPTCQSLQVPAAGHRSPAVSYQWVLIRYCFRDFLASMVKL